MVIGPKYHLDSAFKHFWQKGNGREMIEMSGAEVSLEGFEKFAHLYHEVDTLGDSAAREIFFSERIHEAFHLIETTARNGVQPHDNLPEHFKKVLLQMQERPAWLDEYLLNKGSELCRRSGLSGLIVLRDFTLMGGYNFAYLNKPLIFTEALKKGAVKRLTYTLDFWVNVTRADALQIHAKGYQLCARTRLIHSYSRLMIIEKMKSWDTENWGMPINAWDMIATYIGFSLTFILGLRKLKLTISDEEEAGLFHMWKYIGYLIGIPVEHIPNNAKQATEMFYLWSSIQPRADNDSVMLAEALLNENIESTIYKNMSFRRKLRYWHICCNWFLLDKETNERLQIPRVKMRKLFPQLVITRNKFTQMFKSRKKQIDAGNAAQMRVLDDYLKNDPSNH